MQQDPKTGSRLVPIRLFGATQHLKRLSPSALRRLKNAVYIERRDKILKNADDTVGRNHQRVLDQLNEHDSRTIERSDLINWALSPDGYLESLANSRVLSYEIKPDNEGEFQSLLTKARAEVDEWDFEDHQSIVDAVAGIFNAEIARVADPTRPAGAVTGDGSKSSSETTTTTPPESQLSA